MKNRILLTLIFGVALMGCGEGVLFDGNNSGDSGPRVIQLYSAAKEYFNTNGWQSPFIGGSIPGMNLDYQPAGGVTPFQNPANVSTMGQSLNPAAATTYASIHLIFDVTPLDLYRYKSIQFKVRAQGGTSPASGSCNNVAPTAGTSGFRSGLWNAGAGAYVTITPNSNTNTAVNIDQTLLQPGTFTPAGAAVKFPNGKTALWFTLSSQDTGAASTPCSNVTLYWSELTLLP